MKMVCVFAAFRQKMFCAAEGLRFLSVILMQIAIVDDEPEAIRSIKAPVSAIAGERGLPLTIQEFSAGEDFLSVFAPFRKHLPPRQRILPDTY